MFWNIVNPTPKQIVYCQLPKAGLGNQLFPLMKAHLFGHKYQLAIKICNYNQFKLGPFLRREKSKRQYSNFFNFQKGFIDDLLCRAELKLKKEGLTLNPKLDDLDLSKSVVFNKIPHWSDYFNELKEHRELVRKLFFSLLNPQIKYQYEQQISPVIGVHIRMGDFRKLKAGEVFKEIGQARTPEPYFVKVINELRQIHGTSLPVTVFTDGHKNELKELLSMPLVYLASPNTDIGDMLHLSKSKIIVTSAGSTFSYWSGFLADAPLIMHPDHIHQSIRPLETNRIWYEGSLNMDNDLLINNILKII